MRFEVMKFIDNWVGVPCCLALSLYDRFFRPSRVVPPENEVRQLLLIKFFGLGSIVFITPALRLLRRRYPRAKITFLTFARNLPLCALIPEIDQVVPFAPATLWSLPRQVFQLLRELRRNGFDRVYNFEFHARFPAIVAYLSGTGQIVEFHSPRFYKGAWASVKIPFTVHEHVTNSFAHLVAGGGAVGDGLPPTTLAVPLTAQEEVERVVALVAPDLPAHSRLIVGVNVNASEMALERRWPLANFAELLVRLHAEFAPAIFLLGTESEAEYVESLCQLLPPSVPTYSLAGRLSLTGLLAFLQRCDLVISNDSGPLHLAEAVGVPTVSFFGPETPEHYGPLGEDHLVFYQNLACSPCLSPLTMKSVSCPRQCQCLTTLGAGEVYGQVRQKLLALVAERGHETAA